ncbi:MAG: phosphoribosylanthranilate isomerase [Flavobacteriaceae bacterium]
MPIDIKICGLRDMHNLSVALDAGADMVGFVFFPPSPRDIAPADARPLLEAARGRAVCVALVVDAGDALIDEAVAAGIGMLQLHGNETPARVREIRTRTGLPVMKAVGVAAADDLAALEAYIGVADRILLDAKPPKDATRPGGHGRAFDWRILAKLDPALSFMLSGGLNPANVGAAIAAVRPAGIDVSSGVERAPGIKDEALIRQFIANAREASAAIEAKERS